AVDVGQVFEVTVDLINDGDVDALGAQLAAPVTAGASLVGTAAGPQDVPAGATRTFSWSMQAGSAGQLDLSTSGTASDPLAGSSTLGVTAQGSDANTGAAVSAAPQQTSVTVQLAASLGVTTPAPVQASTQQSFTISLQMTNSGEATALAVAAGAPACSGAGAL